MMNEKLMRFQRRIDQLALMTDTLKAQEILSDEYGIQLSGDEVRALQGLVPKIFTFRVWILPSNQICEKPCSLAVDDSSGSCDFVGEVFGILSSRSHD